MRIYDWAFLHLSLSRSSTLSSIDHTWPLGARGHYHCRIDCDRQLIAGLEPSRQFRPFAPCPAVDRRPARDFDKSRVHVRYFPEIRCFSSLLKLSNSVFEPVKIATLNNSALEFWKYYSIKKNQQLDRTLIYFTWMNRTSALDLDFTHWKFWILEIMRESKEFSVKVSCTISI